MDHETFFMLIQDPAHWELELFIMFIFDFVIGILVWPRIKRWTRHHKSDDNKIDVLEQELKAIKERLGM
jgi:hypothetical protein